MQPPWARNTSLPNEEVLFRGLSGIGQRVSRYPDSLGRGWRDVEMVGSYSMCSSGKYIRWEDANRKRIPLPARALKELSVKSQFPTVAKKVVPFGESLVVLKEPRYIISRGVLVKIPVKPIGCVEHLVKIVVGAV
jgi:hypothetical protein